MAYKTLKIKRFNGQDHPAKSVTPTASITEKAIQLHGTAKILTPKSERPYVNVFVDKTENYIGIQPIKGEYADEHSYKFDSGSVACSALLTEINFKLQYDNEHFPVQWHDQQDMWVVSLNKDDK